MVVYILTYSMQLVGLKTIKDKWRRNETTYGKTGVAKSVIKLYLKVDLVEIQYLNNDKEVRVKI